MTTATLRRWGGAIAVSLPKKVLAMLGLRAGAELEVKVTEGNIVLSPARRRYRLTRLEKEQRALERVTTGRLVDKEWLEAPARGRERL
ncbi:MAG: AbrB/MazE/SpoVT family DNA-binding domain-containing protein [Betaproteobacteria bacterium]|nr:AbrB/MazE/SpoVT family DNA-binding domain-containing protein [Betaproteobacteria bacterium]